MTLIRTYRLGAGDRGRARALLSLCGIPLDTVRTLDRHPILIEVSDDGECLILYQGAMSCNAESVEAFLDGLAPEATWEGAIATPFSHDSAGNDGRPPAHHSTSRTRP